LLGGSDRVRLTPFVVRIVPGCQERECVCVCARMSARASSVVSMVALGGRPNLLARVGRRTDVGVASRRRGSRGPGVVVRASGDGNPLEAAQEFFGGLFKEKDDPVPVGANVAPFSLPSTTGSTTTVSCAPAPRGTCRVHSPETDASVLSPPRCRTARSSAPSSSSSQSRTRQVSGRGRNASSGLLRLTTCCPLLVRRLQSRGRPFRRSGVHVSGQGRPSRGREHGDGGRSPGLQLGA